MPKPHTTRRPQHFYVFIKLFIKKSVRIGWTHLLAANKVNPFFFFANIAANLINCNHAEVLFVHSLGRKNARPSYSHVNAHIFLYVIMILMNLPYIFVFCFCFISCRKIGASIYQEFLYLILFYKSLKPFKPRLRTITRSQILHINCHFNHASFLAAHFGFIYTTSWPLNSSDSCLTLCISEIRTVCACHCSTMDAYN